MRVFLWRIIMVTDGEGRMVNTMVRLTRVRQSAGKNVVADLLLVHDAWMVTPLGSDTRP